MSSTIDNIVSWVSMLRAKAAVVARAIPTYGQVLTGLLTYVAVEVVPVLPGPWAVRVAGWTAAGLAAIATVVGVIARVTPVIDPDDQGLLPRRAYFDMTVAPRHSSAPAGSTNAAALPDVLPDEAAGPPGHQAPRSRWDPRPRRYRR